MKKPKEIERRKIEEERKESHLRVRVTEAQMEQFKAAAAKAGIALSAWVTERLLIIAKKENKKE